MKPKGTGVSIIMSTSFFFFFFGRGVVSRV